MNHTKSRRDLTAKKLAGVSPSSRSKVHRQPYNKHKHEWRSSSKKIDLSGPRRGKVAPSSSPANYSSQRVAVAALGNKAPWAIYQEELDVKWMEKLDELKQYRSEFKTCRVSSVTHSQLYYWAIKQNYGYARMLAEDTHNKRHGMTPDRAAILESFDFFKNWERDARVNIDSENNGSGAAYRNMLDSQWMTKLDELKQYQSAFKTCRVNSGTHYRLYVWARNQYQGYARMQTQAQDTGNNNNTQVNTTRLNGIAPDRAAMLKSIGFFESWERDARVNTWYQYEGRESPNVAVAGSKSIDSENNGSGVSHMNTLDSQWMAKLDELKQYQSAFKTCRVNSGTHYRLYVWARNQYQGYGRMQTEAQADTDNNTQVNTTRLNGMTPDRAAMLESIGFFESWERDARVNYEGRESLNAAVAGSKSIDSENNGSGAAYRNMLDSQWMAKLDELKQYQSAFKTCRVNSGTHYRLYVWARNQYQGHARMHRTQAHDTGNNNTQVNTTRLNEIAPDRAAMLESIGFFESWERDARVNTWNQYEGRESLNAAVAGSKSIDSENNGNGVPYRNMLDSQWMAKLDELKQYQSAFNTCCVNSGTHPRLYGWARNQYQGYGRMQVHGDTANNTQVNNTRSLHGMTPDRAAMLECIGFFKSWEQDAYVNKWENSLKRINSSYPDQGKVSQNETTDVRSTRSKSSGENNYTYNRTNKEIHLKGQQQEKALDIDRNMLDSQWMAKFDDMTQYKKTFHTCRVNATSHPLLYWWARDQYRGLEQMRERNINPKRRQLGMTPARAEMLNSIGFLETWEKDEKYLKKQRSSARGTASKTPISTKATSSKKRDEKSGALISPSPLSNYDERWASQFEELREFNERYRTCRVPKSLCGPLYEWAYIQVKGYAEMKRGDMATHGMSPFRAQKLKSIDFFKSWKSTNPLGHFMAGVKERIERENAEKDEGSHVTQSSENADKAQGAHSSRSSRRTHDEPRRSPRLTNAAYETPLQRAALRSSDKKGSSTARAPHNSANNNWKGYFQELLAYKDVEGHCRVTTTYSMQLYKWASRQAVGYKQMMVAPNVKDRKRSGMTEARAKKLKSVGFFKDWKNGSDAPSEKERKTRQLESERRPQSTQGAHQENRWKERFQELVEYKDSYSHCRVTSTHCNSLYNWAYAQSAGYKHMVAFPGVKNPRYSGMSEARADQLQSIGFFDDWDNIKPGGEKVNHQTIQNTMRHSHQPNRHAGECNFAARFKEMRQYKGKHGTTHVKKSHDQRLYRWAVRMSNYAKNGKLLPHTAKKLQEIGLFQDWNVNVTTLPSAICSSNKRAAKKKRKHSCSKKRSPRAKDFSSRSIMSSTSTFASSQGSGFSNSNNDDEEFESDSASRSNSSSMCGSNQGSASIRRSTSSASSSSPGSDSSSSMDEEFESGSIRSTSSTFASSTQGSGFSSDSRDFASASRRRMSSTRSAGSSQGGASSGSNNEESVASRSHGGESESDFSFRKESAHGENGTEWSSRSAGGTTPSESSSHTRKSDTERAYVRLRVREGTKNKRRKVTDNGNYKPSQSVEEELMDNNTTSTLLSGRQTASASSFSPPRTIKFDRQEQEEPPNYPEQKQRKPRGRAVAAQY
jgi:hypothetical protein